MALETFPTFAGEYAYRYKIAVDTVSYIFRLWYMERHDSWYLSIFEQDETPIRTGIRVVVGWPLNARDLDERLFDGIIVAVRMDDKGDEPPTIDSFDGSIALLLITGDDLPVAPADPEAVTVVAQ